MLADAINGRGGPIRLLAQTALSDLSVDTDVLLKVGTAVVVAIATVVVGRLAQRRLEPRLVRLRSPSFGAVFSRLIQIGIVLVGLFTAVALVFPSVNAATVLGSLGVLSIAAGFAFQDILSNLLAGILLILRQPFVTGDQITVADVYGTVEGITIRETRIRTPQGHLVVVPNQDVYTNSIDVQTNQDHIRTDLAVGIDYEADLDEARELAMDVLMGTEGVLPDPTPQVELVGFGTSSMDFMVRYWTSSRLTAVRSTRDHVVQGLKERFDAAGIGLPFQVITLDADESFTAAMRALRR